MQFCLIDSDSDFRKLLRYHLDIEWPDAVIDEFDSLEGEAARSSMQASDAILVGCPQPGMQGLGGLGALFDRSAFPPVVVFAACGDELLAVDALKAGAASYFPKQRVTHSRLIETLRAELGTARRIARGDLVGPHRHYRLLNELHSTEIATVYAAEIKDAPADRLAIKLLRYVPDSGGDSVFDRFLQEYEIIAGIDHPNVVKIFDLGVADDHAFIAMEFLDGGRLSDRLSQPLRPSQALDHMAVIASALEAIHEAGILHRDLKPANIMFRADGSIALIDFGLAKWVRLEAALTGRGQIFGTPFYMSPEQGHGEKTDARSDLYSLGCIFYEMLTGSRPFTASTDMGVIYQHANSPRRRLSSALARYQPLLDGLMAIEPAARLGSARELIEHIDALQDAAGPVAARLSQ